MKRNRNKRTPAAATLPTRISDCLNESFPPGGRKPRYDGWTPERMSAFLLALAAAATVEEAAQAAGLSPQSAYQYRNSRNGRPFAKMWDAVLVHRARAKVEGDLLARTARGNVTERRRGGEVVEELHYHDNRLAMAMLGRLDRLAEKEAPNEEHLRTLSEDLPDFLDCLEDGGDAEEFIEERCPLPPRELPVTAENHVLSVLQKRAEKEGGPTWRGVRPTEVPYSDLSVSEMESWTLDQRIRALASGWVQMVSAAANAQKPSAGATGGFEHGSEEPIP